MKTQFQRGGSSRSRSSRKAGVRRCPPLASVACALACALPCAASTWYVDDNHPGDPGPGDCAVSNPFENGSANRPFDSIQEAIDASSPGDEIIVEDGTYTGSCGNWDIAVPCHKLTIRSRNGRYSTFLDGGGGPARAFVITGDSPDDPLIQGFTIRNFWIPGYGGAAYCEDCDPVFDDCTFFSNEARWGGAIALNHSDAVIQNTLLHDNDSTEDAGALYVYNNPDGATRAVDSFLGAGSTAGLGGAALISGSVMSFDDCSFESNSALEGGAVAVIGENAVTSFRSCDIGVGGNTATTNGGAIYVRSATVDLRWCDFKGNEATYGAAVYGEEGASIAAANCMFLECTADRDGGGIYITGSTLAVARSVFRSCAATLNRGGAIRSAAQASASLEDSTFESCTSGWGGGAIFSSETVLDAVSCAFNENTAGTQGGALRGRYGTVATVSECTFADNSALWDGGAITSSDECSLTVSDSTFQRNQATRACEDGTSHGGAIASELSSALIVSNSSFEDNQVACGQGGAIRTAGAPAEVAIADCIFDGNAASGAMGTAGSGAGIASVDGPVRVERCEFTGNNASSAGGGLLTDGGDATVSDSTFSENDAGFWGGGAFAFEGLLTVERSSFDLNSAGSGGGGIGSQDASVAAAECDFRQNSSGGGGGVYHVGDAPQNATYKWCRFIANDALPIGNGGAARLQVNATFHNCGFFGNLAFDGGGAIDAADQEPLQLDLANCVFSCNSVAYHGGAIRLAHSGHTTVDNSTFSRNTATASSGAEGGGIRIGSGTLEIDNSIFWENQDLSGNTFPAQIYRGGGVVVFDNSCFTNPACPPTPDLRPIGTNICADPAFIDPDGDDDVCGTEDDNLRLASRSSCIDEGDDAAVPQDVLDVDGLGDTGEQIPLDLDWRNRFLNSICSAGQVDMGAYEFCASIVPGNQGSPTSPRTLRRVERQP